MWEIQVGWTVAGSEQVTVVFSTGNFSISKIVIKQIDYSAGQRLPWLIRSAKFKSLSSNHIFPNPTSTHCERQLMLKSKICLNA